ncbi:reverse transcriptase domain-containing protein [Tanacetum coccineum]
MGEARREGIPKDRKVMNENFHGFLNHIVENSHHTPLECPRSITKTKKHSSISKCSIGTGEGGLFLVLGINRNLKDQSLQARLNFGPEDEVSPPRHRKERRREDNRRPPVFGRIGKQVSGTQTANLQNLSAHENNDWRISVHDRLGSRDVHSRLGQRRSSSESPPSSDSEDSRRKRRRRVSVSSEDTSDNEDAETGHWKSKNRYREDEDMSLPWRRQKVDAFTRRISDFSEDKRRRMPANVKTYDGTGDPDDHLKIFESAATIENWPQPVWCHMFNSTLVGNARNWFSKLPRRSIDGFEELRRAFRLNFTQRKKCAKNPVELARVKQRQGESTSVYVERYKDECIHVKACPEILKISGFMNGINNPELIKRLNDRVPQTFDELMKRTRSFIQGEAAAADSRKGYSNNRSQEQSRRQSNDQSSSRNNSYRGQRGGRGNDKYTPLTMTPKEILATEGSNFPKPPPMRTPEEQRVGNGYCEYHRQKGHTTNECVQLRQLIDKLVKEGRLDHLVKNIKEGKDKQRGGGKKDAPRDKADTIYMVQSWQRKTKQKVSQKFSHSHGKWNSFPHFTLRDNASGGATYHRDKCSGGSRHPITCSLMAGVASADILLRTWSSKRLRPEIKSQFFNRHTKPLTLALREKRYGPWGNSLPVLWLAIKENPQQPGMNSCWIRSPSPYNRALLEGPGISRYARFHPGPTGMLKIPRVACVATLAKKPRFLCMGTKTLTGVPRSFTEHKVENLRLGYSPNLTASSRVPREKQKLSSNFLHQSSDERSPVSLKWEVAGVEQRSRRSFHAVKQHYSSHFHVFAPRRGGVDNYTYSRRMGQLAPWLLTDRDSVKTRRAGALQAPHPLIKPGMVMEFTYALRFEFTARNNEAEYEALIAGLQPCSSKWVVVT